MVLALREAMCQSSSCSCLHRQVQNLFKYICTEFQIFKNSESSLAAVPSIQAFRCLESEQQSIHPEPVCHHVSSLILENTRAHAQFHMSAVASQGEGNLIIDILLTVILEDDLNP